MTPSEQRIINYTPTGTQTSRQNSFAPLSPSEIIEDVHEAYEIGITLAHLHARDEELHNSLSVDIYAKILEGVRRHCPNLCVCLSLSGRYCTDEGLRAAPLALRPDMASLTMSSMNFPKGASINEPIVIEKLLGKMRENGVSPEVECFDSGMLWCARRMAQSGIIPTPCYANVIFGNLYNSPPDAASVASVLAAQWDGCTLCFGGIGKEQLRSNLLGLLYAQGVRIGLEDNLYIRKGEKARNSMLLKRLRSIMCEMGLSHVRPEEFKAVYGNKKADNPGV